MKRGSSTMIYPEFCTNKPNPEADVCNEALLETQQDDSHRKPLKTFVYHSFHDYLGGLLARKDLEEMMDKACDDVKATAKSPGPDVVTDAFEAEFLRSFEWKDGTMFVDRKGVEGRFAFTLNIDFFSVEGNRHGAANASIGIISMACLNLPPELRFKAENMFVAGIIPAPSQPSSTELNHYVRPLIDDMVISWEQGVRYSRTASYRSGRMTHSAIAAVVSDLPAARHAAQFASHSSHHLCTVCNCFHKSNIHRTDWQNWTSRSNEDWRKHAEDWRDAETVKAQTEIFDKYGIRWSEFWRLSYWNPSRQLVIDVMHCILEGITHHYFREAMGLNEQTPPPPASRPAYTHNFKTPLPADDDHGLTRKEVDEIYLIHDLLQKPFDEIKGKEKDKGKAKGNAGEKAEEEANKRKDPWAILVTKISQYHTNSIKFVLDDLKLSCASSKPSARVTRVQMAQALVDWVSVQRLKLYISQKSDHGF
jgi:Transposase family tnp2